MLKIDNTNDFRAYNTDKYWYTNFNTNFRFLYGDLRKKIRYTTITMSMLLYNKIMSHILLD